MSARNELPKGTIRVCSLPSLLFVEPLFSIGAQLDEVEVRGAEGRPYTQLRSVLEPRFEHFPALLDEHGEPWQLGNLYLLFLAMETSPASPVTLLKVARSLAHLVKTLKDRGVGLLDFPLRKKNRATYAYFLFWDEETILNPEKVEVAKTNINHVIAFYRWLKTDRNFVAENEMWKEKKPKIHLTTKQGFQYAKEYITTDLSIPKNRHRKSNNLQAYTEDQQKAIMTALYAIDNPEMTLAFLTALITGGRLQSIFTMPRSSLPETVETELFALAIGDGTKVDSKNQKKSVLYLPAILVEMLNTYISSNRYKNRSALSLRQKDDDDYIFLTRNGRPYYASKSDPNRGIYRTLPLGKSITGFIRQQLEPKLIELQTPLKIRFHNLRATFGNNFLAEKLQDFESGLITYTDLLYLVSERMGHSDITVTQRYIEQAQRDKITALTQAKYESYIQTQMQRLFGDMYGDDLTHSGDP